ncbi:hypothetical protein [Bradyrhizobium sp.]|uniref:hypothetical protein n=1 Tax=Bradyrhizobium sp. TaxID=376 RepID=UPI003C753828
MHHYRTNVFPPYTEEEVAKIRLGFFVGLKFFQDNGLLKRVLVRNPEDVEAMENPKAKDFTDHGLFLYRTSHQKYLAAIDDIRKDPWASCKRILERDLGKMRDDERSDNQKSGTQ